jgi:hypothetical protein
VYYGNHTFVALTESEATQDAAIGLGGYTGSGAGGYTGGSHTYKNYEARVWVYCLDGQTCPAIGSTTKTYNTPANYDNREELVSGQNNTSWAEAPSITVSGNQLYTTWIETQGLFTTACGPGWHHPTAQSTSNGSTWTYYGSACNGLDSQANRIDAAFPSIAIVNGVQWDCFSSGNGTYGPTTLYCKQWNGTSWVGGAVTGAGTTSFGGDTTGHTFAGYNKIIGVGTTPYVGVMQTDKYTNSGELYPYTVYVGSYNGTTWSQVGGSLDPPSALAPSCTNCTYAETMDIASDGSNPWVVLSEYEGSATATNFAPSSNFFPVGGQVIVQKWNGSAWVNPATGNAWRPFCTPTVSTGCDSSENISNADWANGVSIDIFGGNLYIAFTERQFQGLAKLYVKKWDGSTWTTIGNDLRTDTIGGNAFISKLADDGSNLYLVWTEQTKGAVTKVYCDKWNGTTWTNLGGTINRDAVNGTARSPAIAGGSEPIVAWTETQLGQLSQVYTSQWNGSAWSSTLTPALVPNNIATLTTQEALPYTGWPMSPASYARKNLSVWAFHLPTIQESHPHHN